MDFLRREEHTELLSVQFKIWDAAREPPRGSRIGRPAAQRGRGRDFPSGPRPGSQALSGPSPELTTSRLRSTILTVLTVPVTREFRWCAVQMTCLPPPGASPQRRVSLAGQAGGCLSWAHLEASSGRGSQRPLHRHSSLWARQGRAPGSTRARGIEQDPAALASEDLARKNPQPALDTSSSSGRGHAPPPALSARRVTDSVAWF